MKLACYSYKLPFSTPLQTSSQRFQHREGFILSYTTEGRQIYGEAAPLPGFSTESHKSVQNLLTSYQETISKKLIGSHPVKELQQFYQDNEVPPSLQFGLDTLAYQIEAHKNEQPLLPYLFADASPKVGVNGLVSLQADDVLKDVARKITSGFRTIKFKIGLHFENELALLHKVRHKHPELTIRVDANQAWDLDVAVHHCKQLNKLGIEYCEEPLKNITPANIEQLYQETSLPFALDESMTQHSYWPNLLSFTEYLIMKPMIVGSFQRNIKTKRLANTHNNKVVVTTSLESGVGRYFTSLLAAGLGSPNTAHGLSTGFILAKDIITEKNVISEGYMDLSSQRLPMINFDQQFFTKVF
ncbi:o-succinylbenzoate synthase [Aliifodinibius salipaludis]|uniref:o-succinylbenzoate synthase n=1 Tax=Fodinibius salipaludis TaxID=2032627 RepID=A0A2A2GFH3_9BACT|nr:o-succinylbenzoate synthase [Aliifodinibius salipaludis]PAU95643.1 o-succinylbenzoate synthase [Aliifodinibius salipaludis]